MILAVDIGNTNVKIGLFEKERLVHSFKMSSDVKRTSDEYVALLLQLLYHAKVEEKSVQGAVLSSVIPQLDYTFIHVIKHVFGIKPLVVGVGVKTGAPFILVDFGTATTFNVVNEKREFIGGAITLGLKSTVESLARCTAKLPNVDLETPAKVVAQSTRKAIQSGVIFGAAGQVRYMIDKIKKETGLTDAKIIATGGLSEIINRVDSMFDHIDRELSLKGLYQIYKLNSAE